MFPKQHTAPCYAPHLAEGAASPIEHTLTHCCPLVAASQALLLWEAGIPGRFSACIFADARPRNAPNFHASRCRWGRRRWGASSTLSASRWTSAAL